MKLIASAAFLAVTVAAGTSLAVAQSANDVAAANPRADWMPIPEFMSQLEGQGYKIHEFEVDDGHYEVEMTDGGGIRFDGEFDPVTGGQVGELERDD